METNFQSAVGKTFTRNLDRAKFTVAEFQEKFLFAKKKQPCFRIVRSSGSESWAPCAQFLETHTEEEQKQVS